MGKILEWNDENNPDSPENTFEYERQLRRGLVGIQKIISQDVSFVIPRINWSSGTIYDEYNPDYSSLKLAYSGATKLKDANFYALTFSDDQYNLYKCISNNNNAQSTSEPSGTDLTPVTYADGYIWKYMLTIPLSSQNRFLNDDWIPVSKSIHRSFYSEGQITNVFIDDSGSGYTNNSLTTLTINGDFTGNTDIANVRPILNQVGQFIDIIIDHPGNNYSNVSVVISDSLGNGESYYKGISEIILDEIGEGYIANAVANTSIAISTSGAFQPTSNAIAELNYLNNSILSVDIIGYGSGYDDNVIANTTITISTTGNTQPTTNANAILSYQQTAKLIPVLKDGRLDRISIEDPGINYASNLETYIEIYGDGSNANLIPIINDSGIIEDIIIESKGTGYTYANVAIRGSGTNANAYVSFDIGDLRSTQSLVELSAIDGALYNFNINDGGNGYSIANVTVTGTGENFSGNVVIEDNVITKITVVNPGRNYKYANVTIDGDGTNANITPIYSPEGGHGMNSIKEFFSSALMFYSTIVLDKNHNIRLSNDFRQFGIIKNIKTYNNKNYYESRNGSGCFLLEFDDVTGLVDDAKMHLKTDSEKKFYVVSIEDNNALILNDSDCSLISTDILIDESSNVEYSIANVTYPHINKCSGDIIYIDNREKVEYNESQIVTLKTVLKL